MQIHVKAREIFFQAVRFIPQHMSFTLYYFFLMTVSELVQVARIISMDQRFQDIIQSEGSPIVMSPFWKSLLPESFILTLQQPYSAYLLFALTCLVLFLLVGVTFIAQALIHKRDTSLVHETAHSLHALLRAPWAMVYILALAMYMSIIQYLMPVQSIGSPATVLSYAIFFAIMVTFMFVGIALIYYQQLLYDNYHSFASVIHTSWEYFKNSWLSLLKFFLIVGALAALLSFFFILLGFALVDSPLVMIIQFLVRTYIIFIGIIGFNMIYYHVRAEK